MINHKTFQPSRDFLLSHPRRDVVQYVIQRQRDDLILLAHIRKQNRAGTAILDRATSGFSAELLEQAQSTLDSLYSTLRDVRDVAGGERVQLADEPFYRALNDDLNTPEAIAEIHALARALHKAPGEQKPVLKARMLAAGNLLGILQQDPQVWLQDAASEDAISADAIEALITERQEAKLSKNYARADEIREQLAAAGVVLEDSREGTRWKRS